MIEKVRGILETELRKQGVLFKPGVACWPDVAADGFKLYKARSRLYRNENLLVLENYENLLVIC